MSATTTTALDIYELLESIIALLPPKTITQAQRVSKAWSQLIKTSKEINGARVQHPQLDNCWSAYSNYVVSLGQEDWFVAEPVYITGERMCFHPTVKSYAYQPKHIPTLGWKYPLTLMVPVHATEKADQAADTLLTDPPITKALFYYSPSIHAACEVHSPSGVTVKDVIKAASSMVTTELRYCEHHMKMQKMAVSVVFTVVGAQPRILSRRA